MNLPADEEAPTSAADNRTSRRPTSYTTATTKQPHRRAPRIASQWPRPAHGSAEHHEPHAVPASAPPDTRIPAATTPQRQPPLPRIDGNHQLDAGNRQRAPPHATAMARLAHRGPGSSLQGHRSCSLATTAPPSAIAQPPATRQRSNKTTQQQDSAAPTLRKNYKEEPGKAGAVEDRQTDHLSPVIVRHRDLPPQLRVHSNKQAEANPRTRRRRAVKGLVRATRGGVNRR
jgi:hypothetical protein